MIATAQLFLCPICPPSQQEGRYIVQAYRSGNFGVSHPWCDTTWVVDVQLGSRTRIEGPLVGGQA